MVNAHTSTSAVEPQIFSINNIQDALDLFNRGFQVYSNVANGQQPSATPQPQDPTPTPVSTSTTAPVAVSGQKRARSYQPDVDIFESTDAVLVEVSLPGVDKSGIEIEYDSKANRILLSGTSKRTHGADQASEIKVIRTERPVGKFERVIGLGQQVVHSDQISAEYRDGILYLTVPKNKEADTKRRISVL